MTDRPRPAAPRRRIAKALDRRRRPAGRPGPVEPLEGRALLSLSPLDPAFNGGVPAVSPSAADAAGPNAGEAVAVDFQGRVVVAGLKVANDFTEGADSLSVLRYNADGSVDTTFGTAGRAAVALPSETFNRVSVSRQVLIQVMV